MQSARGLARIDEGVVRLALRRPNFARRSIAVGLGFWLALLSVFAAPAVSIAQDAASPLTREFFVGLWETRNYEHGRDVRIFWRLHENGTLDYEFEVDGVPVSGSKGTWEFRDGVMHEFWDRPDSSKGQGRGTVEKLDDNTISLRILDNGDPDYTGIVRVYRRIGPAQLVDHQNRDRRRLTV